MYTNPSRNVRQLPTPHSIESQKCSCGRNLPPRQGHTSINLMVDTEQFDCAMLLQYRCTSFCPVGKRDVSELGVRCSNVGGGCEWTGTAGVLREHLRKCEFAMLTCPNKCKNETIMRRSLNQHLEECPKREYQCPHCGAKGEYDFITESHDRDCIKKEVCCSNNGCDERVRRQELAWHLRKCPFTNVPCKYKMLGCDFECTRKDMPAHEQQDDYRQHEGMSLDTLLRSKEKIEFSEPFQAIKDTDSDFFFYSHPQGYHMKLGVRFNRDYAYCHHDSNSSGADNNIFIFDEYISIYLKIKTGRYDETLEWPFVGSVRVMLLNQKEDRNHHTRTFKFSREDGIRDVTKCCRRFISCSGSKYDWVVNTSYGDAGLLYFKVRVEMPKCKPWLH